MKKYSLLLIVILFSYSLAFAEEAKEKTVTKVEVIEKISTADFFKKKIGDLLSWSVGYDITKINRTNLAPTISYITVTPQKAPPDDRTIVMLSAKVSDPSGLDNIKGVRADLSATNFPIRCLLTTGCGETRKLTTAFSPSRLPSATEFKAARGTFRLRWRTDPGGSPSAGRT
jgi:hypothetical protein